MKLSTTLASILLLASTQASAYDIKKSFNTTSTPSYLAQAFAGWASGLVAHEIGHIATVEYAGGSFEGFDDPKDDLGIPTLWMSGSGSQVGAAAMMGNNTTVMLSNKVLNNKYEESPFLDGFLFFGIGNPISYSLSPDGADFHTASSSTNMSRGILRTANLVQSLALLDKALNNRNDYYDKTTLDISLNERYIKFSNTGKIQTTQQYWIDDTDGAVNIAFDYDFDNYKLGFGRQLNTLTPTTSKQVDYIQYTKGFDIGNGHLSASAKVEMPWMLSNTDKLDVSASLNFTSDYIFANHDTFNKRSTVGLKFNF